MNTTAPLCNTTAHVDTPLEAGVSYVGTAVVGALLVSQVPALWAVWKSGSLGNMSL